MHLIWHTPSLQVLKVREECVLYVPNGGSIVSGLSTFFAVAAHLHILVVFDDIQSSDATAVYAYKLKVSTPSLIRFPDPSCSLPA